MSVSIRHAFAQGASVAALGRVALAGFRTQDHQLPKLPPGPGPWIEARLPPRSPELVRAYIKHVGGDPAWYRGRLPPHLFPQWGFPLAARALLLGARFAPAAIAGTALLTLSKILENMEIGHNVLHGQWDWMRDPAINSNVWEWDSASTAASWKRAHNFQHHLYTNVLGRDRDLGYSAMRVEPAQPWHPVYLAQPIYFFLMAAVFEWAIAIYDIELDAVRRGEKSRARARREIVALLRKARGQLLNVWVHTIVFCGHIPEGAETFTEEQFRAETRGGFYRRQLLGSCNLEGSWLFHLLTGNLSFQIEHHLFPDLPSNRYSEIAPQIRAVCERHGLPYNSGRLGRQYRLAFPGG